MFNFENDRLVIVTQRVVAYINYVTPQRGEEVRFNETKYDMVGAIGGGELEYSYHTTILPYFY